MTYNNHLNEKMNRDNADMPVINRFHTRSAVNKPRCTLPNAHAQPSKERRGRGGALFFVKPVGTSNFLFSRSIDTHRHGFSHASLRQTV